MPPDTVRFLVARIADFNANGRTNIILIGTAGSVEVILGRQPQRIPVFIRYWFEIRLDSMNDRSWFPGEIGAGGDRLRIRIKADSESDLIRTRVRNLFPFVAPPPRRKPPESG